jgi:NADH-quinone oxidoreductase subunit F
MDLKFLDAEATPAERAAIDAAVPAAETGTVDMRVIRTARTSLRHHLLPALDAVQSAIGFVSRGAVDEIARRLHVPPAEIFSVASFYALIALEEAPTSVAHVCDDTACRIQGGAELLAELDDRPDIHRSPCIGQCDRGPAAYIQRAGTEDVVVTSATADRVRAALEGRAPHDERPHVDGDRLLRHVDTTDPDSLDSYRSRDGYMALERALALGPEGVISQLTASNLRGRGGAAFPTGVKWEAVRTQPAGPKYVVCNADESEPGTFKDRVIMEGDPFTLIEAMTIAALTVGAERGFVYIRGEYPLATRRLRHAIDEAEKAGLLGVDIMGSGRSFHIEIRRGQGAYICGEETALFNSIEGFRGEPRQKPPYPVESGLFGRPTVLNSVETYANVPWILIHGGEAFDRIGTEGSSGTRLMCLSGDVAHPGVYEEPFGSTLGSVLDRAGGVVGDLRCVLLGGAAGTFVGPDMLDVPLSFESAREHGFSLGSGVVMAFNTTRDIGDVAARIARFFRDESCGQCVPCRVGTVRIEEAVERRRLTGSDESELVVDIDRAMKDASICGLGHTASSAVLSALRLGLI